ncbi:MAG TPA: RNA-binding protein [Candidatus Sumerlaeota bacterium]|nr:MAG: RNA recognition motif [candidate division BRC1 bacterium ADurb.BinA292]HOE97160.1 RNA-binding protein [Candidatus Sumerlaeota bacterium]HPK03341.1 RNA-binding protein [Candidatus Sumerlaeota bacterium]
MNIYVGNLSYQTTESGLRAAFEEHGEVSSAAIIKDAETGRSKGFGFVEMSDSEQAKSAISALDGSDLDGRQIKVNEARPRGDRPAGGPRGGGNRNFQRRERW